MAKVWQWAGTLSYCFRSNSGFYFKCYVVNCYKLLLQTKVEDENKQLKNQLQSMTEQLNQSETVQRDFVRLSQSLQVHVNKMN